MLISIYRGTNFYIIHKNIQLTCLLQLRKPRAFVGFSNITQLLLQQNLQLFYCSMPTVKLYKEDVINFHGESFTLKVIRSGNTHKAEIFYRDLIFYGEFYLSQQL